MRRKRWMLGSFLMVVLLLLPAALLDQSVQAQPRLALDADTLRFGNLDGAVNTLSIWNAGSDTLRIDSLRFMTTRSAHGWTLDSTHPSADTTYILRFAFGLLDFPEVFPDIVLGTADTLFLKVLGFVGCLVCGGKASTGLIGDTLFIFSSDSLANPVMVPIDFTFYVSVEPAPVPPRFSLQSYPNPAAGQTTLEVVAEQAGDYRLSVFNVLGQRLYGAQTFLGPGQRWQEHWPDSARRVGPGIYFVRVTIRRSSQTVAIVLTP